MYEKERVKDSKGNGAGGGGRERRKKIGCGRASGEEY
jgi:hypothetical protein